MEDLRITLSKTAVSPSGTFDNVTGTSYPRYLNMTQTVYPIQDDNSVYNSTKVFKVPQNIYASTFFLVFTITPDTTATYATPTSPMIIENVFLESAGSIIAQTTTTYTLYRIGKSETLLYNQIVAGATLSGTFNSAQTITLPLYFYTNDNQLLDTRKYPDLSIRLITKGTSAEMGFNQTITDLETKLKVNYIFPKVYRPLQLKNSYNIIQVPYSVGLSGSSSIDFLLNVPYKVVTIIVMGRRTSSASLKANITSVRLRYNNGTESVYESNSNFSLNDYNPSDDGSNFVIPFGTTDRSASNNDDLFTSVNDYLLLSGAMNPVKMTVNYDTLAGDARFFVCFEYLSEIEEIPLKGNIAETGPVLSVDGEKEIDGDFYTGYHLIENHYGSYN